jgi:hypothetical protein
MTSITRAITEMLEAARQDGADSDILVDIDNLPATGVVPFTREFCRLLQKAQNHPRMGSWGILYDKFQEVRNHFFSTYTRELMDAGVIVRKVMGDKAVLAEPSVADGIDRNTELPPSQMFGRTTPTHIRLQRKLALRQAQRRAEEQKKKEEAYLPE